MRRLPPVAFGVLVAATIAAFFITQHLKVSDPLISGFRAVPEAINPVDGRICTDKGHPTSFRRANISFFLPDRSDEVGVFIVNAAGEPVRTVGWRQLRHGKRAYFVWRGRNDAGHVVADGTYYVKVALQKEGRTIGPFDGHPIQVATTPPTPRVTRVTPATLAPPHGSITVDFTPRTYRSAQLIVYRSSAGGKLTQVATVPVRGDHGTGTWNGEIDGAPAPAGTYLIGVRVQDEACNAGSFPATNPPATPTSTLHAGVTVSYLSVTPQLYPVPAGGEASVEVDAGGAGYSWALRRAGGGRTGGRRPGGGRTGGRRPLAHGNVAAGADRPAPLSVRLPGGRAGLYTLTVRSAGRRVTVPIAAASTSGAPVLVVLPALTWQGVNPVDDDGNGIPNTLSAGDRIDLSRPLVTGLPAGFGDEAALLRYLQQMHMRYQLTTDVELAESPGPTLAGHDGVILDGSFTWLPTKVARELRGYVRSGGHVLALGERSLQAVAPVKPAPPRSAGGPTAGPPSQLRVDPFGVRHGAVQRVGDALITTLSDPLGIFGEGSAFSGFSTYQALAPPPGVRSSLAGVGAPAPSIVGFALGRGSVVEVGLDGFGANLSRDDAARELLGRVWKLFRR